MDGSPSYEENGLKKGPWTPEEDEKLIQHIQKHGFGSWRALPKLAGLNRCGKSCRLRWTNYLRPDIKRGKFSQDEEQTILHLHSILGNKWSAIATHLPGRTDNEIKNFWNTHLKKKLIKMGFDPMTHQPRTDLFSSLPHLMVLANLKDHLLKHHPLMDLQLLQSLLLQSTYVQQMENGVVADHDHVDNPVSNLMSQVLVGNPSLFSHHNENYYYDNSSNSSPQPLHQYPALLSHLDPQKVPFSFQPSLNSDHHEHDQNIMGQQLGNSESVTKNMVSNDLQGDYPPNHDYHDHDSSSTWFLPPLSPSNILPNLTDHEALMCNDITIPGDSTSTTSNAYSYGRPSSSNTTPNYISQWPTELFLDDPTMHYTNFI